MKLSPRVTAWLADHLIERAKRTPYDHLGGYMRRWWLVPYADPALGTGCGPARGWLGRLLQRCDIAVRVHEILRDDRGDPHDHPWDFVSVILKNGYYEHNFNASDGVRGYTGLKLFLPGDVSFHKAEDIHKLRLFGNEPAVTLFISFKYRNRWGFILPDGTKVPHAEYEKEAKWV